MGRDFRPEPDPKQNLIVALYKQAQKSSKFKVAILNAYYPCM